MSYDDFFKKATKIETGPFGYQRSLATNEKLPQLLNIPTGCGKTAAVVLAWLWRRRLASKEIRESTPRRLVYCLPMRVLVEQTRDNCIKWLHNLELLGGTAGFEGESKDMKVKSYEPSWDKPENADKINVTVLMGGEDHDEWDLYPERDAIIIGTQDMLLSRALNRGYGMSRYRWPVHFGLLNNDCLWVMDEVQLMGNGLATTTQLQAFRQKFGTVIGVQSIWMSATMHQKWLNTIDFNAATDATINSGLSNADKTHLKLKPRFEATKPLSIAEFEISEDGKREADLALQLNLPNTRTLVIVNTVKRAQAIYRNILEKNSDVKVVLLHSRFRPADRKIHLQQLLKEPDEHGIIAVCTQVIEAGVDISAKTLITDLAPWASMVQRFGRCNREGEFNERNDAKIIVIIPSNLDNDMKLKAAPYVPDELRLAKKKLDELRDVGPKSLPECGENVVFMHVIRQKDMVELFDTTRDLAGADIDISRFIRDTDDHDVQVFWREVSENGVVSIEQLRPDRDELCSVPIGNVKDSKLVMRRWNHLDRQWVKIKPDSIYPGIVLMLRTEDGGYSEEFGWTGQEKYTNALVINRKKNKKSNVDDWQNISEHTNVVVNKLDFTISMLPLQIQSWKSVLLDAARWHDVGKSHFIFQNAIPEGAPRHDIWAKTKVKMKRYARPGFRHELASAILMLQNGRPDITAYIVAAHHGKVRLSIRSLPNEIRPTDNLEQRFARGIWDNDKLPPVDLGDDVKTAETELDLSYMELGEGPHGSSWLARMLALRDNIKLGPFRLAFLETLMRVADWQASGETIMDSDEEGEQ
jgi:CRISPR-associated endonuclease/helicase Cas3